MSRTLSIPYFAALLLAVAFSAPAFAQTVQGRLVDDDTDAPVAEAEVRALDAGGRTAQQAVTGADGAFTLALPAAGRYSLVASRLGYQTVATIEVVVAQGDPLELEVRIAAGAVPLEPLRVTSRQAPPADPALERRGFYTRRAAYEDLGALFLDPEYLSRRQAVRATDVFRDLPGVRVSGGGNNAASLILRGSCEASVFVNGQQVNRIEVSRDVQHTRRSIRDGASETNPNEAYDIARYGTRVDPDGRINLDDLVAASSIMGVEVYQANQVPAEFSSFQARPCGAIVIWTSVPASR